MASAPTICNRVFSPKGNQPRFCWEPHRKAPSADRGFLVVTDFYGSLRRDRRYFLGPGEILIMLRSLAISSFLLMGAVSVAHAADVYRWVDDHGGVHYSDQWVPGSEVIKSSRPRPTNVPSPV